MGSAAAEERALTLHNAHTNERATIVFKRDGRFDPAGLTKLNHFLRDWRQNKPTKMDPKLFDILWEVYKQTGARQPITVVCGYRAPETNAMLRRRSNGVAQNSLHVKGQAMDFFIPGVELATLRAVGLRLQAGGVGFYPSSGSPFVHMDTGSVRHWPRMSRSQLVKVFPDGNTLHVPTDGKPLPGYAQALAAYKARQARGIAVASVTGAPAAVTVAAADEIPLPRIAPERAGPAMVAAADVPDADPAGSAASLLSYPPQDDDGFDSERFDALFAEADTLEADALDHRVLAFAAAHEAPAPSAPAALLAAMAELGQGDVAEPASDVRSASLPIKPTAVVATVEVGGLARPLRADAITTAVLRGNDDRLERPVPPVLAYASSVEPSDETTGTVAALGMPVPGSKPVVREATAAAIAPAQPKAAVARGALLPADLTLTKLDTQGLRLWIAAPSTREKRYALLTMPDFNRTPALLGKPGAALVARFELGVVRSGLRTDRFDVGAAPATVVDLTMEQSLAAR